jgi:hypothetical protein
MMTHSWQTRIRQLTSCLVQLQQLQSRSATPLCTRTEPHCVACPQPEKDTPAAMKCTNNAVMHLMIWTPDPCVCGANTTLPQCNAADYDGGWLRRSSACWTRPLPSQRLAASAAALATQSRRGAWSVASVRSMLQLRVHGEEGSGLASEHRCLCAAVLCQGVRLSALLSLGAAPTPAGSSAPTTERPSSFMKLKYDRAFLCAAAGTAAVTCGVSATRQKVCKAGKCGGRETI